MDLIAHSASPSAHQWWLNLTLSVRRKGRA